MIFATDAHVEENAETFAALQGREEFLKSIPRTPTARRGLIRSSKEKILAKNGERFFGN